MIRWKVTKFDPMVEYLLQRFTDIQKEINDWKTLEGSVCFDTIGIEKIIENVLKTWEKYD